MGETSINEKNNQTILEIDLIRTDMKEWGSLTVNKCGISKYDQYSIIIYTLQCHFSR